MERRKFTREFKLEAVRLIKDRGVSYVQAAQDLGVHQSVLRNWVKGFEADPQHWFPGHGQMKPVQAEIVRLRHEVTKLKAEREQPDLILMDIQLPRISGLQATRRIKARENLRRIPIVAVTSFALSGDDQKAFAAGCDAYIAKPYKPRELFELIQRLLQSDWS